MVADTRGRGLTDLRISLIDQCNLRCTYCMPAEIFGPDYAFLKRTEWLRFAELYDIVRAFTRLGVRKIRLTGGEPLLRPGLAKFVRGLRAFEAIEDLALTTNGLRLAERAGELAEAGLHRVTVSLDALDPELNGRMNGRGIGPEVVLAGIEGARSAGLAVKVNMLVERGVNEGEILPMARLFREKGIPLRFIEFMDTGNHNGWRMDRVVTGREILGILATEHAFEPVDTTSSQMVAKRYRYTDGSAEFGLITSVSQPFCGDCTRARISADGQLFTCLFATKGTDLKGFLRAPDYSPEALYEKLAARWRIRDDRYSEVRASATPPSGEKVEMSFIGG
jgi:cyclic pyranopterin phosphate synthase